MVLANREPVVHDRTVDELFEVAAREYAVYHEIASLVRVNEPDDEFYRVQGYSSAEYQLGK